MNQIRVNGLTSNERLLPIISVFFFVAGIIALTVLLVTYEHLPETWVEVLVISKDHRDAWDEVYTYIEWEEITPGYYDEDGWYQPGITIPIEREAVRHHPAYWKVTIRKNPPDKTDTRTRTFDISPLFYSQIEFGEAYDREIFEPEI